MFSVIISVYKKEVPHFLNDCMVSISEQTLHPDEIIFIADGPLTVELDEVICNWEEKLGDILKVVRLPVNVGLGMALNEGLKFCTNELVIRMDSDDFALPLRFEKQVNFMNSNLDVAVSSCTIEEWNSDLTEKIGERNLPLDHKSIYSFAKFRSPVSHPAVIFRKGAVLDSGGYPDLYPEDYALWGIMLKRGYKFANISQPLLKMRAGNSMFKRRGLDFFAGEVKVYKYLHRIGFLSRLEMLENIVIRFFVRVQPVYIRKLFYKILR